jgi:glycosyltransferase involved in cell wall biosynthesis
MRAHGREADLVHAHDARSHALAALLAKKPIVVSRRVAFPIGTSIASKWKYGRGAMYLAVSKFVAGLLTEAGVAPERIRVVYDGVPLPQRSRIESRREPGRVVALEGKCQEIVRAAAAAAGVPVHFTSSLWEDLSTASIFIYASPLEGLGSAALAAMAAGVPVIASGRGGLEEAVEHQVTGLVVAPEGIAPPEGIAKALRKLLDDPAGAAEMGRRGRERVERKFTVEAMVEATRKAYDEVLG